MAQICKFSIFNILLCLWYLSQTCMAFFREEELVKRAKALKVTAGKEPGADLGPVISKEVKLLNNFINQNVLLPICHYSNIG